MPLFCAAYNCVVKHKKGSGVKFHKFPKNEDLLHKWLLAVRRKDYKPSATAVICSNHFKAEDYYINPYGTRVLKKEVVPSIFTFPDRPVMRVAAKKVLSRKATDDKLPTLPVPTAANSSVTTNDGCEILYMEEQENNVSSTSHVSQMPVEELPVPIPIITTSHESITSNSNNIKKRKRRSVPVYVGDFEESDLICPTKRQRYWELTQSAIQKYRKDNSYLRCKLRRSYNKIKDLNGLLEDLKKRHHISSET